MRHLSSAFFGEKFIHQLLLLYMRKSRGSRIDRERAGEGGGGLRERDRERGGEGERGGETERESIQQEITFFSKSFRQRLSQLHIYIKILLQLSNLQIVFFYKY